MESLAVLLLVVAVAVVVGVVVVRTGRAGAHSRAAQQAELRSLLDQVRAAHEAAAMAMLEQGLTLAQDKLGEKLSVNSRELDLQSEAARRQFAEQAERSEQSSQQRQQSMERQLGDLRTELHRMTELVHGLQSDRARQHGEVVNGLQEAARLNEMVFTTTRGISEALANPKARGNWGERTAEDVLRAAGFVKGVSYHRARPLPSGKVPDFTFELPDGRLLCMDVKFPVDNYFRYLQAGSDHERDTARKRFLSDVDTCVKSLLDRGYVDPELTVDYLLLFIPNEGVYSFLNEHDGGIVDRALGRKVVLCSPYTLFAVLAVIRQSVENFRLARTSDEILQRLTAFSKQWDLFSECIDRLGKQLGTVNNTYEALSTTRRSQLARELDRIDDLRRSRGLDADGEALAGPGSEPEPASGEPASGEPASGAPAPGHPAPGLGNLPDSDVLPFEHRRVV